MDVRELRTTKLPCKAKQAECLTHSPPLKKTGSIQVSFSFFVTKCLRLKTLITESLTFVRTRSSKSAIQRPWNAWLRTFFFYGRSAWGERKPHVLLPWNDKLRAVRVNMQSCQRSALSWHIPSNPRLRSPPLQAHNAKAPASPRVRMAAKQGAATPALLGPLTL